MIPASLYAPFGLRITAGPLEMRVLQDAEMPDYAELLRRPIFPARDIEEDADHVFPWYRPEPDERVRQALQFQWRLRAEAGPAAWNLSLGVFLEGSLRGMQDVAGVDFGRRRVVSSGSWLTLEAHGHGHGRLMRQAMLAFAFDHLGARRAESSAVLGNAPSTAVSRGCGYEPNGTRIELHGERAVPMQHFVVTPGTFVRPAVPVEVEGMTDELRGFLGATDVRP